VQDIIASISKYNMGYSYRYRMCANMTISQWGILLVAMCIIIWVVSKQCKSSDSGSDGDEHYYNVFGGLVDAPFKVSGPRDDMSVPPSPYAYTYPYTYPYVYPYGPYDGPYGYEYDPYYDPYLYDPYFVGYYGGGGSSWGGNSGRVISHGDHYEGRPHNDAHSNNRSGGGGEHHK